MQPQLPTNLYFASMIACINPVIIDGSRGRPILMDITLPAVPLPAPVVIFAHGFKGFKDWGHFNQITAYLARCGIITVKFNFSYNGTTVDKPTEFTDLEAFGHNNLTTELDDLSCVIDYVASKSFSEHYSVDCSRIFLIGHSRGGGIALLKATEDKRIAKVIRLAPVNRFGVFFTRETLDKWQSDGVRYEVNSRTGQMMPMYWQYIQNLEMNIGRLDISTAVKNMPVPALIIHGTEDQTLSFTNSLNMNQLNAKIEILLIDHADHNFGGKHPWEQNILPEHTEMWLEEAVRFFAER